MTAPSTHADRASAGRKGGSARTAAQADALATLHASRRGVRHRPDTRERETVLAEVGELVREPVRGERSIRVVADWCSVSDRTVRRWLSGVDWPPATQVRRLREWVRSVRA